MAKPSLLIYTKALFLTKLFIKKHFGEKDPPALKQNTPAREFLEIGALLSKRASFLESSSPPPLKGACL